MTDNDVYHPGRGQNAHRILSREISPGLTAPELGAHAISAALVSRAGVAADARMDEVVMGNVISAGLKQAPARQAMRIAGLPDSCAALTVNKVCGSGMRATMLGYDQI